MFLKPIFRILTIFAVFFTSAFAFGLESDAGSEITIESDRAEFDRKEGTAIYVGNVILTQGTLLIEADEIILFSDQNQQFNRAIATGKPALFQQQMEEDKGLTKARGEKITYHTLDKTVTLLKNAQLEKEGSSFNGNQIVYDIVNESIQAKGGTKTQASPDNSESQPSGRIKMIIQPAKSAEITKE